MTTAPDPSEVRKEAGDEERLPGSRDYRAFVGPHARYDVMGALQFNLLTALGLRDEHFFLDIGCGSLRAGRLLIPYLLPERYFGIEPEEWLVEEGIRNELGEGILAVKRPTFSASAEFELSESGRKFDFLFAQSTSRTIHQESLFVATYFPGDDDYRGKTWVYPSVVAYRPEFLVERARMAGLECRALNWPHPHGQRWVVFWHPERETEIPAPPTAARIAELEGELTACLSHFQKLYSHPWVRFGLLLSRLIPRRRRRGGVAPPHGA